MSTNQLSAWSRLPERLNGGDTAHGGHSRDAGELSDGLRDRPCGRYEFGIGVLVVPIRGHDKIVAKTTLNAQNLEALGAARLAELLIELSLRNATAKRRLRMELAGTCGTDALAKEVRNRITTMARSRSFVDWQGIRGLADDLDTQRRAIVEKVANVDPKEALDLLWKLMALASSVFERCDDSNGTVIAALSRDLPEYRRCCPEGECQPDRVSGSGFRCADPERLWSVRSADPCAVAGPRASRA